jgi:hypothetical protein
MDSALVGGLIGFGLLVGVFTCTAAYDRCKRRRKPVLPIFTSASSVPQKPESEPLLILRIQQTKIKDVFTRLSIPLAPHPQPI